MAVDETLLEAAASGGDCVLRLYRWAGATVSLGYFQSADEADRLPELDGLPRVRRLTGGGAILHHHEWTYSCTIPSDHWLKTRHHEEYYRLIHECFIAVLRRRGAAAAFRGQTDATINQRFLCFGRGDANDVLLDGHKVLGSAQRRRRGAVLQHGSLLMKCSEYAPEFPGLLDLASDFEHDDNLADELADEMANLLGTAIAIPGLPPHLNAVAEEYERTRYSHVDWQREPR